ncbi:hypothetical protein Glove_41g66 [Diversispora epigaea]|uniref:Uncharacterized protein n=1 Tax=Diversispora epigaea TaxID=1348612 RepID=A0A397JHH8_9GLOM|nr:hypothetical protein Glove_41g66 [Diversispora epigaea]
MYSVGNIRYTFEVAKQITFNQNEKCLSTEYINTHSNLLWGCINRHLWNAPLFNIKILGVWCPFCRNKCENLCHEIVTKYLRRNSIQWDQEEWFVKFGHQDVLGGMYPLKYPMDSRLHKTQTSNKNNKPSILKILKIGLKPIEKTKGTFLSLPVGTSTSSFIRRNNTPASFPEQLTRVLLNKRKLI